MRRAKLWFPIPSVLQPRILPKWQRRAVLRGIQLTRDTGLQPIIVESDAEAIVKWIKNGKQLCLDVGLVILILCCC